MAADAKLGPPQAGGPSPLLKYAIIGGGLILAYVLYSKYKNGTLGTGTAATTTSTPAIDPNTGLPLQSYAVDPTTGNPINPGTGQDFGVTQIGSASSDLGTWTTSAYNALTGLGVDAGQASQALYNYTNGLPLNAAQGNIIDQALQKVGQAPGANLPFNPAPPVTTTPASNPPAVSAIQKFVNDVYENIRAGTVKNPTNAKIAEFDVKSGQASLPSGFKAPAGYTLNPSTRILTKKAA